MLTLSKVVSSRLARRCCAGWRLSPELEAAPETFVCSDYQLAVDDASASIAGLFLAVARLRLALAQFGLRRGDDMEPDQLIGSDASMSRTASSSAGASAQAPGA